MDLSTFLHLFIESGFALLCVMAAIYLQAYGFVKYKARRIMVAMLLTTAVSNLADTLAFVNRGMDLHNWQTVGKISSIVVIAGMLALMVLGVMVLRIVLKPENSEKNTKVVRFFCGLCACGLILNAAIRLFGVAVVPMLAVDVITLLILAIFISEATNILSIRQSFILKGESIENISERLEDFLCKVGTERQNRIRIRFTVEEALISIWQHFGDPSMVRVSAGAKLGRPYIKIDHEGEAFNPFSMTGTDREEWSRGLLASAGLSPTYSYSHGNNVIRIGLSRMQVNPVVTVLIAIFFGLVAGGTAMVTLLPADAAFVTQDILVPVYDLWNRILYSVAAPAMLIIVMSTMLDTREVSEQGGSSGRILGRYFIVSLVAGLMPLAAASAIVRSAFATDEFSRYTIAELMKKFFGIIPENMIDPFRDFNTAQLILMGIILAYAVMAVGQQANGLASFIHQLNMISTQLAQWIAEIMPLFTVFLTAQLVLERNAGLLIGVLTVIPYALAVSFVFSLAVLIYVSVRMDVKMPLLLKKLWPSFALTLKTGQVADSYALAEQCCRRELAIQKIFTQRLMPLGLVLYMPISMIGMISFVVFAAVRSGIVITPVWMLTAIIFALILLVAAPPIPGINLLSYVVIIGQLGIGKEYIIAAMIFDIIFNLFASAANQTMLQLDLVLQADRVGLLNRKKLASDNTEK